MNNPINTDAADRIIQFLTEPPAPAAEVVTLDRGVVETVLRHLEDAGAVIEPIHMLRCALAEPKAELWAIHSVGPGEVFPALSREQAEQEAQELRDVIKAGMGIDVAINVIPSPFEPAEHFEILAEEVTQHRDDALAALKDAQGEWIPVSERLPDIGAEVLTYCPRKMASGRSPVTALVRLIRHEGAVDFYWDNNYGGSNIHMQKSVTHWQPMPAGPSIQQKEPSDE